MINEEKLVDMEMGWRSITQGLDNMTRLLSTNLGQHTQQSQTEPQIPLNEIIDVHRRFSELISEILSLQNLYILNIFPYHVHRYEMQILLQSSQLTESQLTNLKGRYEALSFLSAYLTPWKTACTKWVVASKPYDDARRSLEIFEDELSRLEIIRTRLLGSNWSLACLAFLLYNGVIIGHMDLEMYPYYSEVRIHF